MRAAVCWLTPGHARAQTPAGLHSPRGEGVCVSACKQRATGMHALHGSEVDELGHAAASAPDVTPLSISRCSSGCIPDGPLSSESASEPTSTAAADSVRPTSPAMRAASTAISPGSGSAPSSAAAAQRLRVPCRALEPAPAPRRRPMAEAGSTGAAAGGCNVRLGPSERQ